MRIFLTCFIFFGLIFVSCQKNKVPEANSVTVRLDLELLHNDAVQLYYKMKADDDYNETLSIKQHVTGKKGLQTLLFELPKGIKPKNFRIDLGEAIKSLDSIRIDNITFQYKERTLTGKEGTFTRWFDLNNQMEKAEGGWYYLIPQSQHADPFMSGNRTLNADFVKLFPPDTNER